MEPITIHPKDEEQLTAIKYILKIMKIPFDKSKREKDLYNPEFESKMKRGAEDKKAGRFKAIKTEDLWK
jgi:hypothetical protein